MYVGAIEGRQNTNPFFVGSTMLYNSEKGAIFGSQFFRKISVQGEDSNLRCQRQDYFKYSALTNSATLNCTFFPFLEQFPGSKLVIFLRNLRSPSMD